MAQDSDVNLPPSSHDLIRNFNALGSSFVTLYQTKVEPINELIQGEVNICKLSNKTSFRAETQIALLII